MPFSSDVETALAFVIARISDEAERSGAPLADEERHLLRNLPAQPINPTAQPSLDPDTGFPVIRDYSFETLCTLARNARLHDIRSRPEAVRDWEFAAAVLQLARHPMSWLLDWAGMKKRRPRWDGLSLVGTALVIVFSFILGALGVSALIERLGESWRLPLLVSGACGYALLVVFLYVAARRLARRNLIQVVEKCRSNPRMRGAQGS